MPVAKTAVDKYLARDPWESLAWFKSLLPLEVEEELSYIRPRPKFHCPLRTDQKVLFLVGLAHPDVVFMSDLGSGKTSVSLELLSYFYDHGFMRRGFVFAPTDEVAEGWEDEINKWGFDIPHVRLSGSSRKKWDAVQNFGDGLVIGTYIGVAAMVSKLAAVEGSKKRKRQVHARSMLGLVDRVDAVVYDQSTRLGDTKSLSFEVCKQFSLESQLRYALAGRAFGRDAFVLWSQFFLTDRGRALGTSAGMFREAFWRRRQTPWGIKWVARKRREPELAKFIASSSIRYSIDECVQLPPKVPVLKECAFPDENWAYYDEVVEELVSARGNYREVQNTFLRMRQISSGFIGFHDDETGERAQIEFAKNPKLDLLTQLIDEVPEDRKLIVFYEFTWSGARICQELAKAGHKFGWLWAGTKNWTTIKEAFNDDPDFRVIVANWRKASMGLNLQAANYIFYYESPVSAIERYESEGRIYRTGQKHKSMIYDVVVKDSADEKILQFHKEGKDLFRSLVENPAKYFKRRARK